MTWAKLPPMDRATRRLFEIIRVIAGRPGIRFADLQTALSGPCAQATLHKDLRILKDIGILDDRSHRSGYHVGRSSVAAEDIPLLLAGLQVLGHDLRHPVKREGFARLLQRLTPPDGMPDHLDYPVIAVGQRVIVETLHPDMRDLMDVLAEMIRQGRHITIRQTSSPWIGQVPRTETLFPLQLLFHDVAWYLLGEREARDFVILRLDRLSPVVTLSGRQSRPLEEQRQALQAAQQRLRHGWGLRMPPDETALVDLALRFAPEVAGFIREAPRRHPSMRLEEGPDRDGAVVMHLRLHESSLEPFSWWVLSWGGRATVLANAALRERVRAQGRCIQAGHADGTGP